MKTTAEIEKYFHTLVAKNAEEIEMVKGSLQKANEEVKKCMEKLLQAEKGDDVFAYDKAKTALSLSKNSQEFYQKRLEKLETTPLVEYDEYFKLQETLQTIEDTNQMKINKEAYKHIGKIKRLSEKSLNSLNKADKLFNMLQYEIGKDVDEYKRTKTGAYIHLGEISYNQALPTVKSFYDFTIKDSFLVNTMEKEG